MNCASDFLLVKKISEDKEVAYKDDAEKGKLIQMISIKISIRKKMEKKMI
jgi:hypothetical protein